MRFVRGESLKEAIDRFHRADEQPRRDPAERTLALRQLLRRFIDVCNAIGYAHSRGVIHRDLKPANILLGPYGETLVVNWGLAKVVGRDDPTPPPMAEMTLRPASQSDGSGTMAGSAIGTPSYMSPEQAEGRLDRIGPSSDIYGLGATLYCILTGRPPLDGGDIPDLLRRVQQGDVPPPRQASPGVPSALEAIVMKAMALRPADRYGSARALAEDVERWLADEPVQARREPAWERARRWMRRRRTLVAASAAALMAATVGLAAVLVVQTRANAALQSANLDLGLANQLTSNANRDLQLANTRERARFDLALEAIKTFHGGVSEELLLKERQFDGLRTRLLGGASDFYQRLEALLAGEADRHSRASLGQAYHDIGELTARIGSQAEALAALRRALDIRLALAAEAGFDAATRRNAAKSLIAIGELEQETGEFAGALASYERARDLLEPLIRSEPDDPSQRAAVAKCLHGIAGVQYHMGRAAPIRSPPTNGRGRSSRSCPRPIPPSPHSGASWRRATTTSAPSTGPAGRSSRPWPPTGWPWPSAGSSPRPTPPPPSSRATWPRATTISASCRTRRGSPPRQWRRSSRRERSTRGSPTPTRPSRSSRASSR